MIVMMTTTTMINTLKLTSHINLQLVSTVEQYSLHCLNATGFKFQFCGGITDIGRESAPQLL